MVKQEERERVKERRKGGDRLIKFSERNLKMSFSVTE